MTKHQAKRQGSSSDFFWFCLVVAAAAISSMFIPLPIDVELCALSLATSSRDFFGPSLLRVSLPPLAVLLFFFMI